MKKTLINILRVVLFGALFFSYYYNIEWLNLILEIYYGIIGIIVFLIMFTALILALLVYPNISEKDLKDISFNGWRSLVTIILTCLVVGVFAFYNSPILVTIYLCQLCSIILLWLVGAEIRKRLKTQS